MTEGIGGLSLDRRSLLMGAGALALPSSALGRTGQSLGELGLAKGIRFGSTVGKNNFADPGYRALNAAECALIVPENEMKWVATRPDARRFDFRALDRIIDWSVANGMGVRGHTLLWHSQQWMPKWVDEHDFGSSPKRETERLLADHVTTVAGRYAGVIDSFDVVNEAVDGDTGALRETSLTKHLDSIDVIDLAFRNARAAAPDAQLVYNDYMSWQADNAVHRRGVLRLLEELKKRGTPVDALGVQSHLGSKYSDAPTGLGSLDEKAWREFLDEATGMGLDLLITELDVHDNPLPSATGPRDAEIAAHARAYLDLMLSYRQTRTVMCWGLGDRYSWLNGFRPRPDGLPKRPLPYDEKLRPKPFRDAIAAAFAAAPDRRA